MLVELGYKYVLRIKVLTAAIAQLGERETEVLKVPGSIPGCGSFLPILVFFTFS
jgi:hypothetical protein